MTRALVTGGAGFIGYHLTRRLLEEGWRVDIVDDFSRGSRDDALDLLAASPGVRILARDLTASDTLADVGGDYDYVLHLAAIVGVANVVRQPLTVLRDNVLALTHVVELASRERSLRRLVFLSTSEVYAGTLEHFGLPIPTPESTPLALPDLASPRTSYMLSKLYGEAICHQSGLPFTILRPHNVYGPRMGLSHVVPELLERAHLAPDGGRLEVFSVDHRRTFCYIDDAVETIVRAAVTPACANATLNLGAAGPEVSIRELATIVAGAVGKRLEIVPLPATPGSPDRRRPDVSTTVSLTGFRAETPIARGIEVTYDWYRRHVFGDGPARAHAAAGAGGASAARTSGAP